MKLQNVQGGHSIDKSLGKRSTACLPHVVGEVWYRFWNRARAGAGRTRYDVSRNQCDQAQTGGPTACRSYFTESFIVSASQIYVAAESRNVRHSLDARCDVSNTCLFPLVCASIGQTLEAPGSSFEIVTRMSAPCLTAPGVFLITRATV